MGHIGLFPGSLMFRFLVLFGALLVFYNHYTASGQQVLPENGSLSNEAPASQPASKGADATVSVVETGTQTSAVPDPVKILESFHNVQIETTTNDYNKCERFDRVCCAKILEEMAQNRNIPPQEDICRDRGYEECRCAAAVVDPVNSAVVDTKLVPDPVASS